MLVRTVLLFLMDLNGVPQFSLSRYRRRHALAGALATSHTSEASDGNLERCLTQPRVRRINNVAVLIPQPSGVTTLKSQRTDDLVFAVALLNTWLWVTFAERDFDLP